MIKRGWSCRVVLRYAMLQVPGIVALILIMILFRLWLHIPMWSIWTAIVLWVAKDVILFPFTWQAYDKHSADPLIGSRGTAMECLSPTGYVMVRGELWRAEVVKGNPPINKGEAILVKGSHGLTLLVQTDMNNGHR